MKVWNMYESNEAMSSFLSQTNFTTIIIIVTTFCSKNEIPRMLGDENVKMGQEDGEGARARA